MLMKLWTTGEIQRIRELAADGLSAREIAGHFDGRTRNSVIGVIHRNNIKLRAKELSVPRPPVRTVAKPKEQTQRKDKVRINIVQKSLFPELNMATYNVSERRLPITKFMDLKAWSCRAILGPVNGLETIYCGEPSVIGKSFCPYHCKKYFQIAGSEENE